MKRAFISAFILSLLAGTALAEDEKECTTHANGKFYDLNPLKSDKDYGVVGLGSKVIFPINVCQPVHTEVFGVNKDHIEEKEIAAFIRRGHGDFVIGKVNTTLEVYENHPRMILSSGSSCKSDKGEALNIRASTVVDFICDPAAFGSGQPRLVAALPPGDHDEACAFVIEWRTQFACPTSESGIVWSIFVTIAVTFLSLLLAYTILGTLYNRFVLQLRGYDQIPQFSIESMKYHAAEGLDWAKDLWAIYGPASASSGGGGGLFGVPNNAPNPVSHQATIGVSVRSDLESGQDSAMGTKAFARSPLPRTPVSANRPSPFARAPVQTNPVSHQSQVNAEMAHQRVQSLSERSAAREALGGGGSQASSAASTHLSFEHPSPPASMQPLVSVSPSLPEQPLPAVPAKSPAPVPAPSLAPASGSSSQAPKDFAVGNQEGEDDEDDDDDEEEEESDEESEQDYNEYNDEPDNKGAKELSDFKRPGGASSSRP